MNVSAAVLLQFMLMMQASMFAMKVDPMTFLDASNATSILSSGFPQSACSLQV
jgi:hypothetical protein